MVSGRPKNTVETVIALNHDARKNKRQFVRRISELVSGLTGTEVPRKGLRVRVPCPPLGQIAFDAICLFLLMSANFCWLQCFDTQAA